MGEKSTCLVCFLRTNYNVFHKFHPLQGFCPHSERQFSSKPLFKIVLKLCVFNFAACLIFVVPFVSYLFVLPEICRSDGFMCLIFFIDILNLSGFVIMSLYLFFILKNQKLEMNCWCYIYHSPGVYGLGKILFPNEIKKIRFRKLLAFVLVFFVNVFTGVLCFYFPYDTFSGKFFRKPFIFICYSIQWYIVLELSRRINTINYVLDALKRNVYLNVTKLTTDRLQKFSRLIFLINSNVRQNMKYMAVIVSLWITQSTIGLIFNIFVMIRLYNCDLGSLSILKSRSLATILEIIILLVIAEENINKKVNFIIAIIRLMTKKMYSLEDREMLFAYFNYMKRSKVLAF